MSVDSVARRAEGYGLFGETVDGGDILAVYQVVRRAAERARAGEGATLIAAKVARFTSHSSDDDQRRYRPQEELESLLRRDPIERFRNLLLDEALLDESADEQSQQGATAALDAAVPNAQAAGPPDASELATRGPG